MTLAEYLKGEHMKMAVFARRIRVSPQTVQRYANNGRVPESKIMLDIYWASDRKVKPNDWFDLQTRPLPLGELH